MKELPDAIYLYDERLQTWNDAYWTCRRYRGSLVSNVTKSITAFLSDVVVPKESHVWLNLKEVSNTRVYRTMEGNDVSVSGWGPDQPNGQCVVGCCLMLHKSGQIFDAACFFQAELLCRIPKVHGTAKVIENILENISLENMLLISKWKYEDLLSLHYPNGSLMLKLIGESVYLLDTKESNWKDASDYCESLSGSLLQYNTSSNILTELIGFFNNYAKVWIDANGIKMARQRINETLNYAGSLMLERNCKRDCCAVIDVDGDVHAMECSNKYFTACEIPTILGTGLDLDRVLRQERSLEAELVIAKLIIEDLTSVHNNISGYNFLFKNQRELQADITKTRSEVMQIYDHQLLLIKIHIVIFLTFSIIVTLVICYIIFRLYTFFY